METNERPTVASPAPRHMRKRRLLGDISGSNLPSKLSHEKVITEPQSIDALPAPVSKPDETATTPSKVGTIVRTSPRRKASLKQKRLIALAAVILVSLSIPLLVLTLMFAG